MPVKMALALGLALLLPAAARAQAIGEAVRITTDKGTIEGTLLDRLPHGYLVHRGKATEVIPYAKVRAIGRPAPTPAAPAAPGPVAPGPAAPTPAAPIPADPAAVEAPPDEGGPGLASDPAPVALPMPAGLEPPPPPPPPPPEMPAPAVAPVVLPQAALPAPVAPIPERPTRRRSKLMMGGGIGLVAAGAACVLISGLVYVGAEAAVARDEAWKTQRMERATIAAAVGMGAVAVGIPLWIVGKAKVPVEDERRAPTPAPTLALGPGSARLTVRF